MTSLPNTLGLSIAGPPHAAMNIVPTAARCHGFSAVQAALGIPVSPAVREAFRFLNPQVEVSKHLGVVLGLAGMPHPVADALRSPAYQALLGLRTRADV